MCVCVCWYCVAVSLPLFSPLYPSLFCDLMWFVKNPFSHTLSPKTNKDNTADILPHHSFLWIYAYSELDEKQKVSKRVEVMERSMNMRLTGSRWKYPDWDREQRPPEAPALITEGGARGTTLKTLGSTKDIINDMTVRPGEHYNTSAPQFGCKWFCSVSFDSDRQTGFSVTTLHHVSPRVIKLLLLPLNWRVTWGFCVATALSMFDRIMAGQLGSGWLKTCW